MTFLLALLLIFNQESPSAETETNAIQDRLKSINQNLGRLDRKLDEMKARSNRLSDDIGKLELQRAIVSEKIEKHELELADADRRLVHNESEQIRLQELAAQQQTHIGNRLRKLYKRGSLGYAQIFLKQSRLSELINAYHYAKVLTDQDHQALLSFRETLISLETVKENLINIRAEAEKTRAQLAMQEKNLENLLAARSAKLKSIRQETKKQQKLLADLELEREELYMMIRRLTETDKDPMELQIPIDRYRGKLNWPAKGDLLRKFGVYRDPEFSTKRMQNGIQLASVKGSEVRSVYGGKVVYADWFKSYGNLVIIDHGQKVISFYAHCDRMLVNKGEYVDRDELIAFSGDTGSLQGPILHFEIRNKREPEDPLKWLQKRSSTSKKRRR